MTRPLESAKNGRSFPNIVCLPPPSGTNIDGKLVKNLPIPSLKKLNTGSTNVLNVSFNFLPTASIPPPIINSYNKSPTNTPTVSPINVPRIGIGINVPSAPPNPAPTALNNA